MILTEINSNLCELKVFYYLINNIKDKHKLNDLNSNRLAILARLTLFFTLDYGIPIVELSAMILSFLIAILSEKFIWILVTIFCIPGLVIHAVCISLWICIHFILMSYYKMRFDQIHSSIKSVVSNGKWNVINKRRKKTID